MSPEDLRKDFEIGLLFPGETRPEVGPGCLKKKPDGTYDSPTIQNAWLGYQMCAGYAHALLKRYDPDRPITPGMVTQFTELTSSRIPVDDHAVKQIIRAALEVSGSSPS